MDKTKKATLEDLMRKDGVDVTAEEDKADAISLDEPKKRTWLVVLLTILVTLLVAGGAYVAYQSFKAEKQLTAGEKIETPATENKTQSADNTTEAAQIVYVNASEGLNLRKEASSTSEVLKVVPFGTKLTVLETSGDWYKAEYDSATGWVAKLFTASEDPLVYKNTTYGFQITFPASGWSTYKLFPTTSETGVTAGYYVALATSVVDYSETSLDKGYASMFALSVYTKDQWTAAQAGEGPKPTLAAQNDTYVVGYFLPNGIPPTDLQTQRDNAKVVIGTIKF